jgi:hypothetical protein
VHLSITLRVILILIVIIFAANTQNTSQCGWLEIISLENFGKVSLFEALLAEDVVLGQVSQGFVERQGLLLQLILLFQLLLQNFVGSFWAFNVPKEAAKHATKVTDWSLHVSERVCLLSGNQTDAVLGSMGELGRDGIFFSLILTLVFLLVPVKVGQDFSI